MMGELLSTHVKSRYISEEILIFGSCTAIEYPEILEEFKSDIKLHICLEKFHVEQAAWKIAMIARENEIKSIAVLTVDGSPHCLQLHFALEDLRKLFPNLKIRHYVIEKSKLLEISSEAVRTSRHLSSIEKLIRK
ncbi:MAG: hypothetical protein QXJ68_02870 [Methanocellales archaeon]